MERSGILSTCKWGLGSHTLGLTVLKHSNDFFVQNIGVHFSPPPNLLEIRFQKVIFFTSEKNIWRPFFTPHPITYLELIFKNRNRLTALAVLKH